MEKKRRKNLLIKAKELYEEKLIAHEIGNECIKLTLKNAEKDKSKEGQEDFKKLKDTLDKAQSMYNATKLSLEVVNRLINDL